MSTGMYAPRWLFHFFVVFFVEEKRGNGEEEEEPAGRGDAGRVRLLGMNSPPKAAAGVAVRASAHPFRRRCGASFQA